MLSVTEPQRPESQSPSAVPGSGLKGSTRRLAEWTASFGNESISPAALEWATHTTLDWLAVTIAGASEPLVEMLNAEYGRTTTRRPALLCDVRQCGVLHAALINGAAGHALDFDDVAERMHGHPSAPVMPAALALASMRGASGRDFLRAVVIGHEVESQIGDLLGGSHYRRGFHATGTIGTFGAAAAAASLLGLDAARMTHAFGLAASQAAGLKSMFGTMAKPLHAGKAAMNGVMAAQLAARGFTADTEAIEAFQGFAWTQADKDPVIVAAEMRKGLAIEQTLFKYHASCYLTHSTIEAVRSLRATHGLDLEAMETMDIRVPAGHRSVCDITSPRTGMNLKFSIRHLAVLALDGSDTASLALYVDDIALNPRYISARARVLLTTEDVGTGHGAHVTVTTRDGRSLSAEANVGIPATDLAHQWMRLTDKARTLIRPMLGDARTESLVAQVASLRDAATLSPLLETLK